ncbi:hypothetical protein [Pseudomonas putida]|uniref:hypothetical protein n=1 Tax=Pseudomonas putida TaxID=303 RepID=UPI0012601501|nr:hypothetical protein [Pseudomonas putida]
MNPHFTTHENAELPPLPQAAYARIDDIEISRRGKLARVSFDMVDRDWFERHRNDVTIDFERMPLFHAEISVRLDTACSFRPLTNYMRDMFAGWRHACIEREQCWGRWRCYKHYRVNDCPPSPDEGQWFLLTQSNSKISHHTKIYRTLSSDSESLKMEVSTVHDQRLDEVFRLVGERQAWLEQPEMDLLREVACEEVVVFDVGQGNANGLLKRDPVNGGPLRPTLYFDTGGGVYSNQHTRPSQIVLDPGEAKAIVLSHWDQDHWVGATLHPNLGLLGKTWIAPDQVVGPKHVAFSETIKKNNGRVVLLTDTSTTVERLVLHNGKVLKVTRGSGSRRNDSGLVLAIEATTDAGQSYSIVLTGDCDYRFFSHLKTSPVKALVVPHHGAALTSSEADIPAPSQASVLVYSFGPQNANGPSRVRHPTSSCMVLHSSKWNHGDWDPAKPGFTDPGPHVQATCDHVGSRRNVIIAC